MSCDLLELKKIQQDVEQAYGYVGDYTLTLSHAGKCYALHSMCDSFEELHASLVSTDKKLVRAETSNENDTMLNKPVKKS